VVCGRRRYYGRDGAELAPLPAARPADPPDPEIAQIRRSIEDLGKSARVENAMILGRLMAKYAKDLNKRRYHGLCGCGCGKELKGHKHYWLRGHQRAWRERMLEEESREYIDGSRENAMTQP
jgi:hypothetical protein